MWLPFLFEVGPGWGGRGAFLRSKNGVRTEPGPALWRVNICFFGFNGVIFRETAPKKL